MEQTKKRKLGITIESSKKPDSQGSQGHLAEFTAISSVPLVLVLGNSMLVPILPDLQEKLGVSQFQSSLVISLFSVTAGLIIPISGYLSDRFSRKAIMIPSLIIYGAAGVLAGLGAVWNSYTILIIARAIQGLGAAGTAPIAMALAGDLFKGATESKVLGLTEASNGFGKVVSPILGSLLALIVWYAAFFAFPVFCLLSLLAVIFLLKEPSKEKQPPKLKPYLKSIGQILHEKGRWLITSFFAGSLALFVLFGVLFYLSDLLEDPPYLIDGVKKGFVLAIPLLGLVITSYTTGTLIKKNGTLMRWLINIGLSLMTLSLGACILLYDKNLTILIGLLTLSSVGTGLLLPCLNTMITGSVEREQRGMITSIYSSLRFLGVAMGPPLFSWMMDISHRIIFITVTSLCLIALAFVFFLVKPKGTIS
ncbi:MFS transporter, ACDE family, multidrug resistance protein [Paenibacillus sp. 1_12]|uniref:MFS transporter n=1 Tax=Paenibacillus sp. 1_12 TaxID=1566278 RepID=UPI0008F19CA6|nr:MFS transporter [Paenibacillus sp. 1_12]SFL27339.1 MFS transporter, ACDE family, multidrug resistance protein [Paenibacillus sp. 1_12]